MPQKFYYCDFCPLSSYPQYLLSKLQKVQNKVACLAPRVPNNYHISPHLACIHWLPSDPRKQYKLASLCYNCLSSLTPVYLTVYKPSRQLCSSSDSSILCLPSVCTHSFGQRLLFVCCTVCLEQSPLQS